jgi:MFS family permease
MVSAIVAWIGWPEGQAFQPDEVSQVRLESLTYGANALSYGTAWVQGLLEGGLITFLSIYLLGQGYSEGGVSLLVGGLFAGVILSQLPLAWLADRLGRLYVLLGCHVFLMTALLLVRWCPGTPILAASMFLLGTCCGALYPLGLALLGERVPPAGLARANAWYLASNCAGSLCGPVLFGWAIEWFGQPSQFLAGTIAVAVVLGLGIGTQGTAESKTEIAPTPRRKAG